VAAAGLAVYRLVGYLATLRFEASIRV